MERRVRGGSNGEMGPFFGDSIGCFVKDDRLGLLCSLLLSSSITSIVVVVARWWLRFDADGGGGRSGDMTSFLGESFGLVIDVLGLLRSSLLLLFSSSMTGKDSMQGMRVVEVIVALVV